MALEIPMTKHTYRLAIQWDCYSGKQVDLDLQAVIVDERGHIVDAVYYNNPKALQGAIELSGDDDPTCSHGTQLGYNESLGIAMPKLIDKIKLIIFVVAVYDTSHLRDAGNGKLVVMEEGMHLRIIPIERSRGDVDIVAMMKRNADGSWMLSQVTEAAGLGSHFLDILEPDIGDLIRKEIPSAPTCQQVSFQMEKGAVAALPSTETLKRLNVCFGGSRRFGSKREVDIDIAAVFYSSSGHCLGAVDGECNMMHGVAHSGDCMVGEQQGYDEAISIDLMQIPETVASIFLVLTLSEGSFEEVRKAYARITDQSAMELVRYDIDGGLMGTSLVIAQLLRSKGGRWGFHAVGMYCTTPCRSWRGINAEMKQLLHESEKELDNGPAAEQAGADMASSSTDNFKASPTVPRKSMRLSRKPSAGACGRCSTFVLPRALSTSPTIVEGSEGGACDLAAGEGEEMAVGKVATVRSVFGGDAEGMESMPSRKSNVIRRGTFRLSLSSEELADFAVTADDEENDDVAAARPCGARVCSALGPFSFWCSSPAAAPSVAAA